jgi:molecular chaperone GrpE
MVKKIKTNQELEDLKVQVANLENNYRRALADYQNQERRYKETQSQLVSMANAILIEKLLFPLDTLQTAQKHLKDQGLQMTIDNIFSILTGEGLEEIKSDDQEFDPLTMDCLEITEGEKNKVIETINKGYLLSGKVLRPAKVKVGSGADSNSMPESEENNSVNKSQTK